jgi:hypothetical protein
MDETSDPAIKELEECAARAMNNPLVQKRMAEALERRRQNPRSVTLSPEEAEKVCKAFQQ